MTGYRQSSRLLRIGPFALAVVVFLWAVYGAAQRVLPVWESGSSSATAGGDRQASESAAEIRYDITDIIDAHLFGTVPEQDEPDLAEAPETKLRINLIGLVASADGNLARAIIAVDGSRVKPYSVGQSIDGTDASVHAVEAGRVLLKRSDAIESLSLKRRGIEQLIDAGSIRNNDTSDATPVPAQPRDTPGGDQLRDRAREVQMNKAF